MKTENLVDFLDNPKLSTKDKIEMILSNRIDFGSQGGGMVSVKNFESVAEDLITYFKLS